MVLVVVVLVVVVLVIVVLVIVAVVSGVAVSAGVYYNLAQPVFYHHLKVQIM